MSLSGDWFYWTMLIGVCATNATLVYVAWWALFSDRSRAKRRCPRCWYDLAYSPGMTCAECGFTGRDESQFHRTRRRYRVAAVAIVLSVVVSGYVSDQLSQRGWVSLMPSRVLIALLPLSSGFGSGSIGTEIINRAAADQLSTEQWITLLDRCASGDWRARPGTDAWIAKYGSFILRWRSSLMSQPKLDERLLTIPPQLKVSTRPVWPNAARAVAQVQLNDWWPWGMDCRIRATPRLIDDRGQVEATDAETTFYRTGDDRFARGDYPLPLPAISSSTRAVEITFDIARRRIPGLPGVPKREDAQLEVWQPVMSETVTLPLRAQGEVADMLKPVDTPEQAAALAQAFADGIVRFPSGRSPVRFRLELLHSHSAAFDDVAVGVNMLLYREDVLARHLDVWWLGGPPGARGASPTDRKYGFQVAYENTDLLPNAGDDGAQWHMVIRGDANLALRVGAGTKYWSGEFNVPVKVMSSNRRAPRRAWWTDAEMGDDTESPARDE
jgi:hypothetical protein